VDNVAALPRLRAISWFVAAGVVAFVAAITLENAWQPGTGNRPVSELALGPVGAVLNAAFFLVGIGLMALSWALHQTVQPGKGRRRASRLLVVAGFQIFLLGLFPTDKTLVPSTPHGWGHFVLAGTAFVLIMVSFLVFSRAFRGDPRWSGVARTSRLVAWLCVATFALHLVAVIGPPAAAPLEGLFERLLIAAYLLWVVVSSNHLRRIARAPAKTPAS